MGRGRFRFIVDFLQTIVICMCMQRICSKCNELLDLKLFYKDKTQPKKREYTCKQCKSTHNKAKRRKNRKIYVSAWKIDPSRLDDYITRQCDVCSTTIFPVNKKHVRCKLCRILVSNIHRSLCSPNGFSVKYRNKSTIPIPIVIEIAKLHNSSIHCFYCKREYTDDNPKSLDHIVPKANAGANDISNINICCL